MKEKHVLGVLSVVATAVNPLLGLGFLSLTGWTYYNEYKRDKIARDTIKDIVDMYPDVVERVLKDK